MKALYTMYFSIVIIVAGTFLRFIDLSSSFIGWTSDILLIVGSIICLRSVFSYIRPDESSTQG
ncbi:MAG: hypothetical protein FWJ85_14075 [Solitalea sp.]